MKCTFALVLLTTIALSPPATSAEPDPTTAPADLLNGAEWEYSLDGGKTFEAVPPVIKAEATAEVLARLEFSAEGPGDFVCLELRNCRTGRFAPRYALNGTDIRGPMKGMSYRTIRTIEAKLLRKGKNTLTASLSVSNKARRGRKAKDVTIRLAPALSGLKVTHLKLDIGPVLGAFGKGYFTITCRTNMPARLTLGTISTSGCDVGPLALSGSSEGLLHRFRVKVNGTGPHEYQIDASCGRQHQCTVSGRVKLPSADDKLRFVAMGDSRSHPKDWAKVAAAVLKAKPDLIVFSGDMVANGRRDWEWPEQFFEPAKELFATIPFYAVIGNHEADAPLYNELFYTPSEDGRSRNWSQTIGDVLLIGVDGTGGWSKDGKNAKWLERTLAASKAKFIFLFDHYPAWTSGGHGKLGEDGMPKERSVRYSRTVIMPLLEKYKATAMIVGHDHFYERSNPPGGVVHVISGGAGAPLRKKVADAERQNPHSKVFHSKLHYLLLEIDGDTCKATATTPDGEVLDTFTMKARTTE